MSDLKLTAEEVAWVKAYVEANRNGFCCDSARDEANGAARLAPAEPVVKESLTTEPASSPTLLEAARAVAHHRHPLYGIPGGCYTIHKDTLFALDEAIAREDAAAGKFVCCPECGTRGTPDRFKRVESMAGPCRNPMADAWQARAESAERDLAACHEQVKEAERVRDNYMSQYRSAQKSAERILERAQHAERQRDDWQASAESVEHRAEVAETKAAKRHDTIVDLRAQLTAAEAERDRLAKDVAALKAAPPLAAVRKALEAMRDFGDQNILSQRWLGKYGIDGETAQWEGCGRLAREALRALDAATPAAQVVEAAAPDDAQRVIDAAVKARPALAIVKMGMTPDDEGRSLIKDLVHALSAYLAAKGEVRA